MSPAETLRSRAIAVLQDAADDAAHAALAGAIRLTVPGRLDPGTRRIRTAAIKVVRRRQYLERCLVIRSATLDQHGLAILEDARAELAEAVALTEEGSSCACGYAGPGEPSCPDPQGRPLCSLDVELAS